MYNILTAHLVAGDLSPVMKADRRPVAASGSLSGLVPATVSFPLSARLEHRDFNLTSGEGRQKREGGREGEREGEREEREAGREEGRDGGRRREKGGRERGKREGGGGEKEKGGTKEEDRWRDEERRRKKGGRDGWRNKKVDLHVHVPVILVHPCTCTCSSTCTCIYMHIYTSHVHMHVHVHVIHMIYSILLVEFVSLGDVEYEELISAVRRKHLQSTVSEEVATFVYLPHYSIRPLYTAEGGEQGLSLLQYIHTCVYLHERTLSLVVI